MDHIFVWTLKDVIGLVLLGAIGLVVLGLWVVNTFSQRGCKHLRVRETRACDAICRDCGQNLGFIQYWRDANRGNPEADEISN